VFIDANQWRERRYPSSAKLDNLASSDTMAVVNEPAQILMIRTAPSQRVGIQRKEPAIHCGTR
jgi:hypothetical protein